MNIIDPRVIIRKSELSSEKLINIEKSGRVCYQSQDKITPESAYNFVSSLIDRGHESVLEHEKVMVNIICDRGVSHEIVRHRIASYSQESTRYCNYAAGKFGQEITVIEPFFFLPVDSPEYIEWCHSCIQTETVYMKLLEMGHSPQEARSILPNSLKTEIVVSYNMREWRHFFRLRCSKAAHPQMRQIAIPLLLCFQKHLAAVFEDIIDYDKEFDPKHFAEVEIID